MKRVPFAHHMLFWSLALGGAALDLGSKAFAFSMVGAPPSKIVLWDGVFSFTTSYNRGALWGLGNNVAGANHVFAGLSVVAALAILYVLFAKGAARDRTHTIALGLIMAGTQGNCYDRLLFGKVRDFLYFELINWPIFNLADSFLVCGAFVLIVQAFFFDLPQTEQSAAPATQQVPQVAEPNQS